MHIDNPQSLEEINKDTANIVLSEEFLKQLLIPFQKLDIQKNIKDYTNNLLRVSLFLTNATKGFIALINSSQKLEFIVGLDRKNNRLTMENFIIDNRLIEESINIKMVLLRQKQKEKERILCSPLCINDDLVGILYHECNIAFPATGNKEWKLYHQFLDQSAIILRNAQYRDLVHHAQNDLKELLSNQNMVDRLLMTGSIASEVGIEITNLLTGINASMEVACEMLVEDRDKSLATERIRDAQEMLISVALLSGNLLEKQVYDTSSQKTNLNSIILEFIGFFGSIFQRSGVNFDKKLDTSLPDIVFDKKLLLQIIFNLVRNAAKKKPNVSIKFETEFDSYSERVNLIFSDNSPNVFQNNQIQIFKSLYSDNNRENMNCFSLCKNIIENHKGRIVILNNGDQGKRMVISFPVTYSEELGTIELDRLENVIDGYNESIKTNDGENIKTQTELNKHEVSNKYILYSQETL